MVLLYLAQYSIFQNVLITILLLHLSPPEFVPLHVVGNYVPNFYPWLSFVFSYQAAYKALCRCILRNNSIMEEREYIIFQSTLTQISTWRRWSYG